MHHYEVRFDESSGCWELRTVATDTAPAERVASYNSPEEAITGSADVCEDAAANNGTINLTVRSIDGSALCERTFAGRGASARRGQRLRAPGADTVAS